MKPFLLINEEDETCGEEDSTDKARKLMEDWCKRNPGKHYAVYQRQYVGTGTVTVTTDEPTDA